MQQKIVPAKGAWPWPRSVPMHMIKQAAAVLRVRKIDRASQLIVRKKAVHAKQALQIRQ